MTCSGCEGCIFMEMDRVGLICSISDDYIDRMSSCPLFEEAEE